MRAAAAEKRPDFRPPPRASSAWRVRGRVGYLTRRRHAYRVTNSRDYICTLSNPRSIAIVCATVATCSISNRLIPETNKTMLSQCSGYDSLNFKFSSCYNDIVITVDNNIEKFDKYICHWLKMINHV